MVALVSIETFEMHARFRVPVNDIAQQVSSVCFVGRWVACFATHQMLTMPSAPALASRSPLGE